MYKTALYMLVNGVITLILLSSIRWHLGNAMLRVISPFLIFAVFDV